MRPLALAALALPACTASQTNVTVEDSCDVHIEVDEDQAGPTPNLRGPGSVEAAAQMNIQNQNSDQEDQ